MKRVKIYVVLFCAAGFILPAVFGQDTGRRIFAEAATGFDNQTNGFVDQSTFDADREAFEEREAAEDGLGPCYNAQSCAECHQSPVTGGISQISVLRAGHRDKDGNFVDAPGGSLINERALDPAIQETVPASENVRTFRTSLNVLGDGYVEAVDDETLLAIARGQARLTEGAIAGQAVRVPILEAPGETRVGRFGWKSQQASLLSFSADAYLNEMGITNRLLSGENTSLGRPVAAFDSVLDPEDTSNEIDAFAEFMRATKAPARGRGSASSPDVRSGERIFEEIGCAVCHVPSMITAPIGAVMNGGTFVVSRELGNKVIHPYGDFLLHEIGTGDGIVQNGDQSTANKLRTAPLWGVRTRTRLMHDGQSLTFAEAIERHKGEAASVIARYQLLNSRERAQVIRFLHSL